MLTRRDMFRTTSAGAVALAVPGLFATPKARAEDAVGFTLPKLPYEYDALEPSIDGETMTIHHTKHHAGYVAKLNAALEGKADWLKKPIADVVSSLKDVPEEIRTAVRNNGGGHYNHSLFWSVMAPTGKGGEPKGDLLKAIEASFITVDEMKKQFTAAASTRFGSGWAWLVPAKDKPLTIISTANQDNPLMMGGPAPILGLDVWEHAYYLKYRNLRPKYIEEWWKIVNWDAVAANLKAAK